MKLPEKQSKKRRLWLGDGSCARLRPEHRNHVWSYDFVEDKTMDGRKLHFLNIPDEHTHTCLVFVPRRSWRNNDVIALLSGLTLIHGTPEYLRSDNRFVKGRDERAVRAIDDTPQKTLSCD